MLSKVNLTSFKKQNLDSEWCILYNKRGYMEIYGIHCTVKTRNPSMKLSAHASREGGSMSINNLKRVPKFICSDHLPKFNCAISSKWIQAFDSTHVALHGD